MAHQPDSTVVEAVVQLLCENDWRAWPKPYAFC